AGAEQLACHRNIAGLFTFIYGVVAKLQRELNPGKLMILDYEYLQSILQGEGLIVTDFYFPCGSRFGGFGTIYLAVDSRRKQDQRQYNYICFHCFNGWGGLFFFQLGSAGLTLRGLR